MKRVLSRIKKVKGQAAAIVNLLLAIFAVGLLAVFCFELSRYFLSRDELKTSTEAAALCCETALVTSGDPTNPTNQTNAMNAALALFQQNAILGQSMSNAIVQTNAADLVPSPGQAQICFQFLDPVTRQPMANNPGTTPTGALIQATGAYCYTPAFGQFIGLGNAQFTFQVSSFSGVPRIDVALIFDISGGSDSYTPGSPIQRGGPPGGSNPPGSHPPGGTGGGGTGGGTGGGNPCVNPPGLSYMFPVVGGNIYSGGTIADMCGHPGSGSGEMPHILPPQKLELLSNFPSGPLYSESPASPATNSLAGYNGNLGTPAYTGVSPGNLCWCPPISYLNNAKKPQLVASAKTVKPDTKEDLQHLCAALNRSAGIKEFKKRTDLSKLDDKLSTICFAPHFSAYQTNIENNSSGGSAPYSVGTPYGNMGYSPGSHTGTSPNGLSDYSPAAPPIPGKCPIPNQPSAVAAGPAYANVITDLVCNIDSNTVFSGNFPSSYNSNYVYYDASSLVEASRGNLDTVTSANNAFVDYNGMATVPTSGFAADYFSNAQLQLQPMNDLLNACASLISVTSNVADVHFSFIAFNDTAGNSTTGVTPAQYSTTPQTGYLPFISSLFPYAAPTTTTGSTATYILPPLPFVALDPNNSNSNLISLLPPMRPNGNRNVSAALQAALNQINTNGRPGANKAIVLFCSGVPTEANVSASQALADAASAIQGSTVPVYCVTVSDPQSTSTPSDDSANDTAYGSTICALSAPGPSIGPKYYRVDWTGAAPVQGSLSTVVDNIVRQMVGMMH